MLSLYEATVNGLTADVNGLAPWVLDGYNLLLATMRTERRLADAHEGLKKRMGIG